MQSTEQSVLAPFMSSDGASTPDPHEASRLERLPDRLSRVSSSPASEPPPISKKKKAIIVIQCEAASTPLVIIRAPETKKPNSAENKTVYSARSKQYEEDALNDDESSLYEYDGGSDSSASSSSSDYQPAAKHKVNSYFDLLLLIKLQLCPLVYLRPCLETSIKDDYSLAYFDKSAVA
ncbi:unnamed protein product [Dibothriocephalus latus]|uniref:Uncharacterized protein n=1 Tax=Dibothriocephalus latus TaxID=60516 RepID=A0A3P7NP27_DIBLA|nr:unnamed protein product [Dibothriocephalus latus]